MQTAPKIRTRKTNGGWHPYIATMRGEGAYGFGNTPAEARACLLKLIAQFDAEAKAEA